MEKKKKYEKRRLTVMYKRSIWTKKKRKKVGEYGLSMGALKAV